MHDIRDPRAPVLVATFDTDSTHTDSNGEGAFGVYPRLGLDRILVADRGSGLWIVDITGAIRCSVEREIDRHPIRYSAARR